MKPAQKRIEIDFGAISMAAFGIAVLLFIGLYFGSWCITALGVLTALIGICNLITGTFGFQIELIEKAHELRSLHAA